MEMLLLIILGGVVAYMWNRVETLERKVRWLKDAVDAQDHARWLADLAAQATPEEAEAAQPEVPTPPEPVAVPSRAMPEMSQEPVAFAPLVEAEPAEEHETTPRFAIPRPSFRFSLDFEDLFGRQLPIWAGGIALAIAGFFLVRWSIENGLLNEQVRVALGFAFGTLLIAAAEVAHRFEHRLADERVRQALAGAGLATLYASFYLAGTHYGLIGGGVAFAGLAVVTALAIALSYRFGLPSAVLGLVGGFAAPALAGSTDPNLPLLATYLALVTGGLAYTGRKQAREWLGLAALAAGLGWGAVMLVASPADEAGVLALGGYLVLVGTMVPTLLGQGLFGRIGRIAACALATLQIAALVDQSGYSLLAWGCYILLAAAIAALGWQHRPLRDAGAMAAALSVLLIAAWPDPSGGWLALIAAAMAAIFVGTPLARIVLDKGEAIDWAQLALYPLALTGVLCVQLWIALPGGQNTLLALAALALAMPPAIAAWMNWEKDHGGYAHGPLAAMACATATLVLAGLLATPAWAAPLVTAGVAAGLFAMFHREAAWPVRAVQGAVALAGVALLLETAQFREWTSLVGEGGLDKDQALAALRWLAAALPFALLMEKAGHPIAARAAQVLGTLFAYGALAQLVDYHWMPFVLALAAMALAWRMRWRAAQATAMGLSFLWALPVLVIWGANAMSSLAREPMMAMTPDDLHMTARQLLPMVAAWFGSLVISPHFFLRQRQLGWVLGGAFAVVAAHLFYKLGFAIRDMEQFAVLGMAERTVWQALIAAPALALLMTPRRWAWQVEAGAILALVSLAHFATYSLGLHNPLWDVQHVGGWPVLNLLLPAYAIAIALVLALRSNLAAPYDRLRPLLDGVAMVLIALLVLSELRQAFSGTVLVATMMSQQEDLLRSILAIALALAFLGWGAWKKQRSWRIGSLVLMLLAVAKVFLFDAAGLEGLARIASFLALGLCLIGIGWFYTRQLKADGHVPSPAIEGEN